MALLPSPRLTLPMTSAPLPLPATDTIRGEQPAADLGGAVLRYRCADEVAPFARPVIERYRQYHAAGEPLDGLRTMVGFTMWRLRQSGAGEYWLTAADYASDDIVDVTTEDLTFALWIEAAQTDTIKRAGARGDDLDLSSRVLFTKAALTVVDKGRPDELVLERRPPADDTDSGWLVRTAERSFLRNKEVEIIAGVVAGTAPHLLPYLTLPTGSVVRVADGRHLAMEVPGAEPLQTLTTAIGGVTLTAQAAAHLAPLVQGVLDEFAAQGTVAVGSRVESGYTPFVVEQGEGGTLRVVCADFSSPEDYRSGTTADLSVPLATQVLQAFTVKESGVPGETTRADESVAIQAAALEDIVQGVASPLVMERVGHAPGREVLADGTRRSGWWITAPRARSDEEVAIRNIDAGELQASDPTFAKYYCLPHGTMLRFAVGELVDAHLVDDAKMAALADADPTRTMGDLLASGEASRRLPLAAGS